MSSSHEPTQPVHIIGSGLAGSEAAYYLAERGIPVVIHEMRPEKMTPAHQTDGCAELVCSNSFKSKAPHSAPGMMKAEMAKIGSLILKCGMDAAVPGGDALAVDRDIFSQAVTKALRSHPNIQFVHEEMSAPVEGQITLIATGPLTSDSLSAWIAKATGADDLYFYDAIAPIIDASTIDMENAFIANRYGKGGEDAYINCPMNEAEYNAFIDALTVAEKVQPKSFEKEKFFQGCQPIEAIAATGRDSLRFGPMKPVGLDDPKTGRRPYAVIQLRPENNAKTAYNMVGFQTKLKYGEQGKVFRMIRALKNAEFLRLGSIHRNTYICGPRVLRPDLSLKGHPKVYFAGQVTGVEGYLESTACGLLAAIFIEQRVRGLPHSSPPGNTALGALLRFILASDPKNYQPNNMNFSLFDPNLFEGLSGESKLGRDEIRKRMAEQSIRYFSTWWDERPALA
jgi:methylenetetrahydrofolate--tRNA-(uracil-5-)-methyltransferase